MKHWQDAIRASVTKTLGEDSWTDRERALRFLEEALELVQVVGLPEADIRPLVVEVYSRAVGNLEQEIGGTFVSFLALVEQKDKVAYNCLVREVERINTPEIQDKMRRRQLEKRSKGF